MEFEQIYSTYFKSVYPKVFIEERIEIQDEAEQIRKILHTISDPYKEVFMWRVFGKLSFKEIGELYGKTDNWACVTYRKRRRENMTQK